MTIIKNAKIVLPSRIIENAFLRIKDSKILDFGSGSFEKSKKDKIIDAKNNFLCPAFIDIHCHGALGADFSNAKNSDIEKIAEYKLSEGVATLIPTTLCVSEKKLKAIFSSLKNYDNKFCKMPCVHLEGPFLNKEMSGSQNPKFITKPNLKLINELDSIFKIGKISYSPECDKNNSFAKEYAAKIALSAAHSKASYNRFLEAYKLGVKNITHFFNRCSPMTSRDFGLVGAGLHLDDLFVEIIADFIHIAPDVLNLLFKVKNYKKIILISDAINVAGLKDGNYNMQGIALSLKNNEARVRKTNALAGSVLKINEAAKNLLKIGIPLKNVIYCASTAPAKSLNLKTGQIKKSFPADLVILDSNLNVQKTFVNGTIKYQRI